MTTRTDNILGTLLVVAIGIAGAILLAHWAACEQYEGLCAAVTLLGRLTERDLDKRIAEKAAPACNGMGCYPDRCPPGECVLKPAEACTELGAEPDGQHRTSPLIRAYLAARHWLF
jgi:hypothetical protein